MAPTVKETDPLDHLEERIQKAVGLVIRLREEKELATRTAAEERESAERLADTLRVDLEEARNANTKLEAELADRYGPVPDDIRYLIRYSAVKTMAEKIGIEAIDRRGPVLNVKFHEKTTVDGEKLMALVSATRGAQFTPAGVLRLPMEGVVSAPAVLGFIESGLMKALT